MAEQVSGDVQGLCALTWKVHDGVVQGVEHLVIPWMWPWSISSFPGCGPNSRTHPFMRHRCTTEVQGCVNC